MNELKVFEHEMFGSVRVMDSYSNPWFVAKDVCKVLDLANVGQAVVDLDESEKSSIDPNLIIADVGFDNMMKAAGLNWKSVIPEAGRGGRPLMLISESGLYSLVFKSRKPEAKAFKKWITSEVLPTIRKTGSYNHNLQQGDVSIDAHEYIELLQYKIRVLEGHVYRPPRPLSAKDKATIISLANAGLSYRKIAKMCGHCRQTVNNVVKGNIERILQ